MATNKFTKFATIDTNAVLDTDLQSYVGTGIPLSSPAFSNILNGAFRQVTAMTWSWAEFLFQQLGEDITSEGANAIDETSVEDALDAWVADKGYAANANMPFEKSADIAGGQPLKLQIWWGTQAEYDLLTPNNNTLYYILR